MPSDFTASQPSLLSTLFHLLKSSKSGRLCSSNMTPLAPAACGWPNKYSGFSVLWSFYLLSHPLLWSLSWPCFYLYLHHPKNLTFQHLLLGHHLLSFHFINSTYYLYSINCLILLSKHFSNTQLIPWFNNLNTPLWILINSLSLSPYIILPSKF